MATRSVVAAVALVSLSALSGCANQKEVIPLLHVEPNAGPRMLYFERRSRELFGAHVDARDADDATDREAPCEEAPLKTWGAPSGQAGEDLGGQDAGEEGTSCDSARND